MMGASVELPVQFSDTLARTAIERNNLYGFLSAVFRQDITARLLRQIKAPKWREALSDAGVELDKSFWRRSDEQVLVDLAVEYARLFLGPGRHISLHESVQIEGGSGRFWGSETVAVKSFIDLAGFAYNPLLHDIPDHFSVELEFMAKITLMEASAWEHRGLAGVSNCLEFERRFMTEHLASWAGTVCKEVRERAELAFYRGMARLTAGFLEAEHEEIAQLLEIAQQWRQARGGCPSFFSQPVQGKGRPCVHGPAQRRDRKSDLAGIGVQITPSDALAGELGKERAVRRMAREARGRHEERSP